MITYLATGEVKSKKDLPILISFVKQLTIALGMDPDLYVGESMQYATCIWSLECILVKSIKDVVFQISNKAYVKLVALS